MKTNRTLSYLLFGVTFLSGVLTGCKKNDVPPDDPTKGFSTEIQGIIPEAIIDDLRQRGMTINEGKVPPKIEGAFRAAPFELVSPFGPEDSYEEGKVINAYDYKFYGHNSKNAISYDFTNYGSDTGNGKGAFVAGNGNSFTIFSEDSGVSSDIPYKTVAVLSGEITATGIRNFQYAFILKEKTGDADDTVLIPVSKGRIWKDGDGMAEKTSGLRIKSMAGQKAAVSSIVSLH